MSKKKKIHRSEFWQSRPSEHTLVCEVILKAFFYSFIFIFKVQTILNSRATDMLVLKNVSTDAFLPCLKKANKIDKRKAGETDKSAVTAFFLSQISPLR